ncbi:hypothetical protein EVA_20106 [gut metagenome]|uniref:Uncharacterized protein n=1 Tax=gut metagenome TaxID=749906 RepID=J9FA49_9ZZZZ
MAACTLKLPSISVTEPLVVPFTRILTPISGSPFASFTLPFTVINSPDCMEEAGACCFLDKTMCPFEIE